MKFDRATDSYNGGSGKESFNGELFRVVHWSMNGGSKRKTTVEFKVFGSLIEAEFDGLVDFESDESCMEQFEAAEIIEMMAIKKREYFADGERSKLAEIKAVLNI